MTNFGRGDAVRGSAGGGNLLTNLAMKYTLHRLARWLARQTAPPIPPAESALLPARLVTPRRESASAKVVDDYGDRGQAVQRFAPERVVHFRAPDPRDPYCSGLSPLRACFEQAALTSEFAAMKRSIYDNAALP